MVTKGPDDRPLPARPASQGTSETKSQQLVRHPLPGTQLLHVRSVFWDAWSPLLSCLCPILHHPTHPDCPCAILRRAGNERQPRAAPSPQNFLWRPWVPLRMLDTQLLRERIAQLKQQERELQDRFTMSHSSVDQINALAAQLVAVAEEIAKLEGVLASAQPQ